MAIRHPLVRDAIYAGITMTRRRRSCMPAPRRWSARRRPGSTGWPPWTGRTSDWPPSWSTWRARRRPAAAWRLAATHLQWASDISPARADRERRLLTAALHLMLAEESRGLALRPAVEAAAPSPLRSCVLGTMAFSAGQLGEAQLLFSQALAQARNDPDNQPLAALIANRLAGTYTLAGGRGEGDDFGRWALGTGCLDAAAASQTRTLIAIGASQVAGPRAALAELGHLDADPARVGPVDVDGLSFRGVFRLLAGDLGPAISDLTASLIMARRGATLTLACAPTSTWRWPSTWPARGTMCCSPPSRGSRPPLSIPAASTCRYCTWRPGACRPAGARRRRPSGTPRLAEEAAASLDYGQERLYAAMARALVCQAAGDYLGMADALGHWRDDAALDGRSRVYAVLWRPLLAEGLVGSGQLEPAAAVLDQLRGRQRRGQLPAAGPGLAGGMAGRAARRPRAGPGDLQARRGHRRHAKPGVHRPAAAGLRQPAAPHREQEGRGRAPAAGWRLVPCATRRAVHRPG